MTSDEALYEAVVRELERDGPRKGLWAKAYAEAVGNEPAARAIYMRLRVAQLAEEMRRVAEAEEQARQHALKAVAQERQREIDSDPDTIANNRLVMAAGVFFLVAIIAVLIFGNFSK